MMMEALIRWSLRNRALVLATAFVLLAGGVYSALRMPEDVFPDLTAPTVTVLTEAHGMEPQQVENQVTFPLETALNGAAGVRRVRSSTSVGIAVVWVEFDWGTDILAARQTVGEKLSQVSTELPPEVGRPMMAPISSIMGEVLFIALTSDRHSPIELRTYSDSVIRRRLLSVPGVSQVTPIGGEVKQFQVMLSMDRLRAYDLGINQVVDALAEANKNVSAGILNQHGQEYLITGVGRAGTLDAIGETVVRATNQVPVRVSDLGNVRIGAAPKRGEGSANAQPAVVMGIQKQPGDFVDCTTNRCRGPEQQEVGWIRSSIHEMLFCEFA
jgi:Cu/Ag efflux pump CusA